MSGLAFAEKQSAAPGPKDKSAGRVALGNLRIGEPDDSCEREADQVADEIMAGGRQKLNWSLSRMSIAAPLQRKCSCGRSGGAAGGECARTIRPSPERPSLRPFPRRSKPSSGPGE